MISSDDDSRLLNTCKSLLCLMQLISTKLRIQKRGRKPITPVAIETLWNHAESFKRQIKELTDMHDDIVELLQRSEKT